MANTIPTGSYLDAFFSVQVQIGGAVVAPLTSTLNFSSTYFTAVFNSATRTVDIAGVAGAGVTFAAVNAALAVANASIAVNSQKITGLGAGVGATDAVNVGQLNSALAMYVPVTEAGLTGGDGNLNVGEDWVLAGAPSASTEATVPLLTWDASDDTLTFGFETVGTSIVTAGDTVRLDVGLNTGITVTSSGVSVGTALPVGLYNAPPVAQQTRVGQLTDSTTGTPATSVVDAGLVYSQATTNNNNASLLAKINALELRLSQAGGGIGVTA